MRKQSVLTSGVLGGGGGIVGRRSFIKGLAACSLATAGLAGLGIDRAGAQGLEAVPELDSERDYTRKATFDWMLETHVPLSPGTNGDEAGYWSWLGSQIMLSLCPMFEAYGDRSYLDKLVAAGDQALAQRDSIRGVSDYRGRSLPAWRIGTKYTTGGVTINGVDGIPIVRLRIGQKGDSDGSCGTAVVVDAGDGTLALTSADVTGRKVDTFDNLSLDPASPDYIVDRLYWATENVTKTTAVDLRESFSAEASIPPGTYEYESEYKVGLIGAGVITTPLAWFAAIVRSRPELHAEYGAKANEYIEAVEDCLLSVDDCWRENGRAEGWYVIPPDDPSVCAGADGPHNSWLGVATSYTFLARATGSAAHRLRARKLLNRFRNHLTEENGAYVWPYFCRAGLGYQGWTQADGVSSRIPTWGPYHTMEDLSHAYIDVLAVYEGWRDGISFTNRHMMKFAATFVQNVEATMPDGTLGTAGRVNGGGGVGSYARGCRPWIRLAAWDPSIATFIRDLMNQRQYGQNTGPYPLVSEAFLAAAYAAVADA